MEIIAKKYKDEVVRSILEIPSLVGDEIPFMTAEQYKKAKNLTHQCCNYDRCSGASHGDCLLLECPCAQEVSYSLICKWFRIAVLPENENLYAELIHPANTKRCERCGKSFVPGSNRAKYCKDCSKKIKKEQTNARVKKHANKKVQH